MGTKAAQTKSSSETRLIKKAHQRPSADAYDVVAQLVGNHDPRLAELSDQPLEKPLGCFSVSSRLHENVEDVPFC